MKLSENQTIGKRLNEKSDAKSLRLTVDDCTVTLNFSPKTQDTLMTEVKRMILSGHTRAKI
jgi:hypothetical protein